MISELATQISDVSAEATSSSYTKTHDMALYRLLLWDLSTALAQGSGNLNEMTILNLLAMRHEECLALSDIDDQVRAECSRILSSCPGYIGSYKIDAGNPVLRQAFYDGLMHLAYIDEGYLIQQRSLEGDEDGMLNGAHEFRPNGLRWIDNNYEDTPRHFQLDKAPLSQRGAVSVDRLKRKKQTTVEGRIFQALVDASWTDRSGKAYKFSAAEPGSDILQAALPEGKFTKYLFNKEHSIGGAKASFIIDELGFDPEDWRYLAAQFYDGLLLSTPRDLQIKRWKNGMGAQFNVLVEVTSRAGKRGVIRTGWILEPGGLPRLITAVPDHSDVNIVRPPKPPVLFPKTRRDVFFEELCAIAGSEAKAAYTETLPTPIINEDFEIIEEGETGSAYVLTGNDQSEFSFWLLNTGRGSLVAKKEVLIFGTRPSQSLERAEAYARAFARVLALNGVPSRVEVARA